MCSWLRAVRSNRGERDPLCGHCWGQGRSYLGSADTRNENPRQSQRTAGQNSLSIPATRPSSIREFSTEVRHTPLVDACTQVRVRELLWS